MDMDVALVDQAGLDAEGGRLSLDQGERGLDALAHDLAQLAGQDQLAAAGRAGRLDEQYVAAHRRPGEAGGHARHAGAHGDFVLEPHRAQQLLQVGRADPDLGRRALGNLHRDMAQRAADLAFEAAHARLAGIARDDLLQCCIVDLGLLRLQPVGLELAPHQVAPGDLELFARGVAGERDDLHAVAQRAGDRVQHVGGGDEDDAAQVERHVEVIVAEGAVLLRVEHFQHRRRRIAVHAGAHLVDLVQHQHAVARARLPDRLDDVAGQRADVGPPMAADLGLVVHAAQADARELAAHGAGDRLAQRRLADAGRSGEAQDRRLAFGRQLAHGQVFDDALLDLFQAEMVVVEHAAGLGDVDRRRLGQRPGQLDQRVEIGADHAPLGRRLRRAFEPAQLLARHRLDVGRHLRLADRLVEVGDLLLVRTLVAQLALDRRHLLAQQHLALAGVERGLGRLADLVRQFQHFQPLGQQARDLVEARHQLDRFQDLLLLRRLGIEIGRGEVGQRAGRTGGLDGLAQLRRHLRQQVQHFAHLALQHEEARLDLGARAGGLDHVQAARHQERMALDEFGDAEPLHALADHVMRAVGRRDVAHDVGDGADLVEIAGDDLALLRVALQGDQHLALLAHRLLGRGDRGRPSHRQRKHHLREEDEVARRQHDERIGGQRIGRQRRSSRLARGRGAGGVVVLAGVHVVGRGHGLLLRGPALVRLITRQPFTEVRRTLS